MTTKALAVSAEVLLGIIVLAALFADFLPLPDPFKQDAFGRLVAPGGGALMGTDNFGRDVFSRIVFGARSSLYIALASVALGTVSGVIIGTASAYRGGWFDAAVQRVTDALLGFPILVMTVIFVVALGPSATTVMVAIAIGVTPQMVRLARSRTLSVKEETFVTAARAEGIPPAQIMVRHVLPRVMPPILAYATGFAGIALIIESALHFLGLGVPPPYPSWGGMIQESRPYLEAAPWMAVFPGLALSATAFCFIFLGDAVRDMLDPRARQK